MATQENQHKHTPDYSFPGPLEEEVPQPVCSEGFVVVGCDGLEVLSISATAKSMLCYKHLLTKDQKARLEDLFSISSEQLQSLRSCSSPEMALEPRFWNNKYGNRSIQLNFCPKYRLLIVRLTAEAFGKREAINFARGLPCECYILFRMNNSEKFEEWKLVDSTPTHIIPSQPSPANLGSTVGEMMRQGVFTDSPFPAKLRKVLGYPLEVGDEEYIKQWIVASDDACFLSLHGGLHRGSVCRLPNQFVLLRVYRIWHEQDVSPLNPPHSDVVGCSIWDVKCNQNDASENQPLNPTLIYANDSGKKWMGDPNCIGKTLDELAPELITSGALERLQQALQKGCRQSTRHTFVLHETRSHRGWIYDTYIKRVSRSCVLVSFVDISHKMMNRAVRSHLYALLNAVPTLCLLATHSLEITWLNCQGRQLADIPDHEDVELNIKEIMPDIAREIEAQDFKGGGKVAQTDLISRTGRHIPVAVHFITFDNSYGSGSEVGPGGEEILVPESPGGRLVAVFAQDLTAEINHRNTLMAEKQRAEDAASAKSDFLATMSHEIRTPLHGIVGTTDILEDASVGDLWQQQQVRNIRDCSMALLTLINDVLDFAKIEAKKIELEHSAFLLTDCVDSALAVLAAEVRRKKICVFYTVSKGPIAIMGDKARTRQIILNLLSNSIKFTAETGSVDITACVCKSDDRPHPKCCLDPEIPESTLRIIHPHRNIEDKPHKVWIMIKDSGVGMNEAQVSQIFEPFVQLRSVGSSRGEGLHGSQQGTGLGLSIVKRLLDIMGGGCEVRSRVGSGTSFLVWFPCEVVPTQPSIQVDRDVAIALKDTRENSAASCLADYLAKSVSVFSTADEAFRSKSFEEGRFAVTFVDDLLACNRHKNASRRSLICLITADPVTRQQRSELEEYRIIPVSKPLSFDVMRSLIAQAAADHHQEAPSSDPSFSKASDDLPKIRILVVDDNNTNIFVIEHMLRNVGVVEDITIAHDGQEALERLKESPYDIILMDIHMPKMSGWEAARIIREKPAEFQHCGIIVALTAAATLQDREESLRYMDVFLCKPVQLESLASALNEATRRLGLARTFKRGSSTQEQLLMGRKMSMGHSLEANFSSEPDHADSMQKNVHPFRHSLWIAFRWVRTLVLLFCVGFTIAKTAFSVSVPSKPE